MLTRRQFATAAISFLAFPTIAAAQEAMPSSRQIQRQLEAAPRTRVRPEEKVTIREFKRRPELRREILDLRFCQSMYRSFQIH